MSSIDDTEKRIVRFDVLHPSTTPVEPATLDADTSSTPAEPEPATAPDPENHQPESTAVPASSEDTEVSPDQVYLRELLARADRPRAWWERAIEWCVWHMLALGGAALVIVLAVLIHPALLAVLTVPIGIVAGCEYKRLRSFRR